MLIPTQELDATSIRKASTDNSDRSEWKKLQLLGLVDKCSFFKKGTPTCGKILAHAKDQITSIRERHGVKLCIFKIGVTSDPPTRFEWYAERGYTCMWVLHESSSADLIHMLEAALILHFGQHVGCRNKPNSGGEGALGRKTVASLPPFYVYVAAGRADQGRWLA